MGDQTAQFAETARRAAADAPVPTCPEWTLSQLVEHVGQTQHWVASIVEKRVPDPSQLPTSFAALPADPDDAGDRVVRRPLRHGQVVLGVVACVGVAVRVAAVRPDGAELPTTGRARARQRTASLSTNAYTAASLVADCARRVRAGRYGREMEIINLGKADGLPPVDWTAVVDKLDAGSVPAPDAANSRTTWLSTVNEDGSPHVTAVGALWMDGTFWFQRARVPARGATSRAIRGVRSRCLSATQTS